MLILTIDCWVVTVFFWGWGGLNLPSSRNDMTLLLSGPLPQETNEFSSDKKRFRKVHVLCLKIGILDSYATNLAENMLITINS